MGILVIKWAFSRGLNGLECTGTRRWVALHWPHCSFFQLTSFGAASPICLLFFGHMQVATQPTPLGARCGATILFKGSSLPRMTRVCRPWCRWIYSDACLLRAYMATWLHRYRALCSLALPRLRMLPAYMYVLYPNARQWAIVRKPDRCPWSKPIPFTS